MLTFKLLSMATLLGVAFGVIRGPLLAPTVQATPPTMKVVTWNEGGGAPTTEFMGPWSSAAGKNDMIEKVFGAKILQLAYGSVDAASQAKIKATEYSYARYSNLDTSLENPKGSAVVGDWLKDLGTYILERDGAINDKRWLCWESVTIEKVFKFAMKVEKGPLFKSPDCHEAADEAKNLFGGPDNCYKLRRTRLGSEGFQNLVVAEDHVYWHTWFGALGDEWGPPDRCKMKKTMSETLKNPEDSKIARTFAPDWVSLAIFDRLLVEVARSGLKPEIWPVETEMEVNKKITDLNTWLCQHSDVLMLQETKSVLLTDCSSSHQVAPQGKVVDAAVVFNRAKYVEDGVSTKVAEDALKKWADQLGPVDEKKATFFNAVEKFAVVVIRNLEGESCHTIMSIHSDSEGKYANDCLQLAVNTHEEVNKEVKNRLSNNKPCELVVGMDTNVQLQAGGGALDVEELTKFATSQSLDVFVPNFKTVSKTRSFAQAQILKAAKADNLKKDFIFRQKANKIPGEISSARVVNQIDGQIDRPYLQGPFPRVEYPVDHFMVFVDNL